MLQVWLLQASSSNSTELNPRGMVSLQEQASLHPMRPQRDAQMPLVGEIFSLLPGRSSCGSLVTPHRGPEAAVHRLGTANCVMCWGRLPSQPGASAPHPSTACCPAADSQARQGYARRIRNDSLVKHAQLLKGTHGDQEAGSSLCCFHLKVVTLAAQGGCGKLHRYCCRLGYGSGCPSLAAMFGGRIAHQEGMLTWNLRGRGNMSRKTKTKTKSKIIKPDNVLRASTEQGIKRGPGNRNRPRLLIRLNNTVQRERPF